MMTKVLIDANIWLGFWSVREGRVSSELISAVSDLKTYIVFTKQISDEIARRKLDVFYRSSDYREGWRSPDMPLHMLNDCKTIDLNRSINDVRERIDQIKTSWNDIRNEVLWKIANDDDPIYVNLKDFFINAKPPSSDQMQRARLRRECGNPPGKKGDTLGDQISWEQFLDEAQGSDSVHIVSRDNDFSIEHGKERILNPILRSDLISVGVEKISVFDTLSEAVKSLKAAGLGIAKSIDVEKLDSLQKEEVKYAKGYCANLNPEIWICPGCGTRNIDPPMIPRPSSYGGWTYHISCKGCGTIIDCGEPCD